MADLLARAALAFIARDKFSIAEVADRKRAFVRTELADAKFAAVGKVFKLGATDHISALVRVIFGKKRRTVCTHKLADI